MKNNIFLIDIDGTICDDINNEDFLLFPYASPYHNSQNTINKWYDEGNTIVFFTARTDEHRKVTEEWLKKHNFKYHSLIMNKPRCKPDQEYIWIDNRRVRGITFNGKWSKLVNVLKNILVFDN